MLRPGRVEFGEMDAVVFGKPAAEAIAGEARRYGAERVFLMASGTLNRTTDEVAQVRDALANGIRTPEAPDGLRPVREPGGVPDLKTRDGVPAEGGLSRERPGGGSRPTFRRALWA